MSTEKGSESFDTDSTFTKLSLYTDLNARRTFISKECRAESRDCFLISCFQCVSISAVISCGFRLSRIGRCVNGYWSPDISRASRSLETPGPYLFCCTFLIYFLVSNWLLTCKFCIRYLCRM
jgi:hypothetical protein